MNWGHRIIILYVGFVLLIGTMVYLSSRENVDLVSSDYYDQEIKFQSKMEAERQLSSSKIVLAKPKSLQLDK